MAQISLKKSTMKLKDGSGTPKTITIKFGQGNLTYSEKRTMEYLLDRGVVDEVREGDDVPVDVKFEGKWEYVTAETGDPPTIEDCLKNVGEADDWVSSDSDTCRPYALDIEVTYAPACTGVQNEVIVLSDFRWENIDHDLKAGTISVSGKCNITKASSTRVTP